LGSWHASGANLRRMADRLRCCSCC
jgi:hypothetical protein